MNTHSVLLLGLAVSRMIGSSSDTDWVLCTFLRVLVGILVSDFRFCCLSNFIFAIVLCGGLFFREDLYQWCDLIMAEALIVSLLSVTLWVAEKGFASLAVSSMELRASVGAQWAMWNLLQAQCADVVQLGPDMRVHKAVLARRSEAQGDSTTTSCPSSTSDTPVCSSTPIQVVATGDKSKTQRGHLLADFVQAGDERAMLEQTLSTGQESLPKVEVLHVSLCDREESVAVRLYHIAFMDDMHGDICHLVGICENSACSAEPGTPSPPLLTILSSLFVRESNFPSFEDLQLPAVSTQAAVLLFDALDPGLHILKVSDQWITCFGSAECSLFSWFGKKLVAELQKRLQGLVSDALSGGWSEHTATSLFRKVTGKYPDGTSLTTTISLTLLNPEEYYNADANSYVAMLSAENVSGLRPKGSSSRASSRSSGASSRRTLPTVKEDEEDASLEK